MINITFRNLKSNYSPNSYDAHDCTMYFPNTCAIRMSEALVKTNSLFLSRFKGSAKNKCPHGYLRGAQDLASVLSKPSVLGSRTKGWNGTPNATIPDNIKSETGIICFMNIPGFDGQGHIDLWDKTDAVGNHYWDAETIWFWSLT
ncbi:hypothetical protein OAG1_11960 [Agarivorans sp. OAG1]|uniref:T6SS effector amidase Tae4 family protein n=1 Tax=Agarivorans sp. OAG1 TaxID=3082387 RepID=UPI002B31C1F5|nr:hypothetical protein OAG1_11960 [Agarivorans sp. OAG1]